MAPRILLASAVFAALVAQVHAQEPATVRPVVKIGIILPLTGAMAQAGGAFRDASLMALEDLRADTKFQYQLLIEDDRLEPRNVAAAAAKLINIDHVDAIVSTWSYGGSIVAPLAERARTLHFGVAWDASIANGRYSFLHLTPPREFLTKILAVLEALHCRRLASYAITESGALFALDELDRLANEKRFTVVKRSELGWMDNDFKPALMNALPLKPQAVYVNLGPAIDLFMKQVKELGINQPIIAMTGYDVIQDISLAEGRWYVSDSYLGQEFTSRLKQRAGNNQVYGAGNYYDIVQLISYLFEQSSTEHKPAIPALLPQIPAAIKGFPSVFGRLEVDEKGVISYPAQYLRIKNGVRAPATFEEIVSAETPCQD